MESALCITKQKQAAKNLREYPTEWTYYSDDRLKRNDGGGEESGQLDYFPVEEKDQKLPGNYF
jgi:hypothetical protein